jgi:PIN domain nuclease of toxin-antitoxin system
VAKGMITDHCRHADPFDRLIIAQVQRRGMTVITADETMQDLIGVAFRSNR